MHFIADRSKEKLSLHLSQKSIIVFFCYERGHSFVHGCGRWALWDPYLLRLENTRGAKEGHARFLSPSLHTSASSLARSSCSTVLGCATGYQVIRIFAKTSNSNLALLGKID